MQPGTYRFHCTDGEHAVHEAFEPATATVEHEFVVTDRHDRGDEDHHHRNQQLR